MGILGRSRVGQLAVALLSMPLALPAAAHAAPHARRFSATPQIVQAGGRLTAVLQPGDSSRLAFYLSKDRHRSRHDVSLGVKRLRAASGQASAQLRVPRRTSPIAAYLLACAPKKSGPCTASPERVAVIRRPSPARARPVPGGAPAMASVGAAGGSVSGASNGGTLTLTVPAGALIKDTAVTLTPLASVGGGLPGHLSAAAELDPDGLPLERVAQLRPPGASGAGIAFSGGGANLHLTPLAHGQIAISTLGGGGGAIRAPRAKLAAFARRHVAADPISQLEQLAAVAVAPRGGRRHPRAAASGAGGGNEQAAEINAYLTASAYQVEAIGQADFLLGVADYQQWDVISHSLPGNEASILPALEAQVKAALTASGLREVIDDEGRCAGGDLSRRTHMLELEAAANSIGIGALSDAVRGAVARCFQFDLLIDSEIEHNDEGSGFEGSFHWHYQAKVALDYESLVPSATHFSAHGSHEGKYVTAEGTEIEADAGECNDNDSTVEGIYELLNGDGGSVDASGDFTVPLVPNEPPRVSVTFSSSARESYLVEVRDESDAKCEGSVEVEIPQWWYETWLSLASAGGTAESRGAPITISLEPPDPKKAPDAGLIGELTVPSESNGDHGTTTIKMIHDPGHVLLPGLPPA